MGDSDEEEEDETNMQEKDINEGIKKEHILPVLEWLKG